MERLAPHLVVPLRRFALLRIGGLPTRVAQSPGDGALLGAWTRLREAVTRRVAAGEVASAALFDLVGMVTDRPTRNRLLAMRRALFNGRAPSAGDLAAFVATAPESVRASVAAAETAIGDERFARQALAEQWRLALAAARARLVEASRDPDFEKGLLLSSRTLHDNLAAYRAGILAHPNARLEQIERGVLRYLTRTAMKATPFGRLCAVAGARFREGDESAIVLPSPPAAKIAAVRLNKSLQAMLWGAVKAAPTLRRHVPVELNPTVDEAAAEFVVLTGSGAVEAFRRIKRNDAIDIVVSAARRAGTLPLRQLADALHRAPEVEATVDEAFAYLESLLNTGLLRFNSGIPGQSAEWEEPLRRLVSGVEDETAATVTTVLEGLVEAREEYARGSIDDRIVVSRRIGSLVDGMAQYMPALPTPARDLPLYEDAALPGEVALSVSPNDAETLATLERYLRATLPLAWPRAEQLTMRHVFERLYPDVSARVPLLRFYEAYYREHYKEHMAKEALRQRNPADPALSGYNFDNPLGLPEIKALGAAKHRLTELIRAQWRATPEAEEVSVDVDAAVNALAIPAMPMLEGRSLSSFTVPIREGNDRFARIFVPNGSYAAGYGKFFSRFLHVLPDEFRKDILASNRELHPGRLAEIASDGFFNANLHPSLTDDQISYPTGDGATSHDQLSCRDLVVERHAADPYALVIRHRETGETIHPLDLGFQNPRMRPPLYQLLARMAPVGLFGLQLPESPSPPEENGSGARVEGPASPRVTYRPRLTLGGRVVLSRRSWTIPRELFPTPTAEDDDVAYFDRLTAWRAAHGIPGEVYARVIARPAPGGVAAERPREAVAPLHPPSDAEDDDGAPTPEAPTVDTPTADAAGGAPARPAPGAGGGANRAAPSRSSKDFAKPQYIDFANPLLVRLFAKLPSTLPHFVVILEERYPPGESLPSFDGEQYSIELLLQFDWTAEQLAGGDE